MSIPGSGPRSLSLQSLLLTVGSVLTLARHRPRRGKASQALVDPGRQRHEEGQGQRGIAGFKRRAAALGLQVKLVETAA